MENILFIVLFITIPLIVAVGHIRLSSRLKRVEKGLGEILKDKIKEEIEEVLSILQKQSTLLTNKKEKNDKPRKKTTKKTSRKS